MDNLLKQETEVHPQPLVILCAKAVTPCSFFIAAVLNQTLYFFIKVRCYTLSLIEREILSLGLFFRILCSYLSLAGRICSFSSKLNISTTS